MKIPVAIALVLLTSPLQALQEQAPADLQQQREEAFAKLLTGSVLKGFTTLDGKPGLEEDSYTLKSVTKREDGQWRFEAVIHYGGRPVPIAIPLPVEWAGDSPVISVTDLAVPFMGTYDARVLFHGDRYVGVWSGADYGGHIFGRVVRAEGEGAAPDSAGGGQAPSTKPDKSDDQASTNWPSFRGHQAAGQAEGFATPESWDLESGENLRWRVPVDGLAHSSPVVWGDRIFLTTAVREAGEQELVVGLYGSIAPVDDDSKFRFEVHCYDKHSGEALWKRVAWSGVPAIARHPKGSHAASTPAVDGERVVAFFGSEGLFAFDHEGEPLWDKSFGVLDSGFYSDESAQWGFASSPVLHEGRVVVQCDVQGQSFLTVLDATDGQEIWRTNREEEPGWSTPTVARSENRYQIVCNGWKHMGGYDWASGEELWRVVPGGDIPVPTPVVAHGMAYLTNFHGRAAPILAIDLDAVGEVSFAKDKDTYMHWGHVRGGNYMQTPLIVGDMGYFCRDNGVLTCLDARTGEKHYSERLGSGKTGFTASGVATDGKLYFPSEVGDVYVVRPGAELDVAGTYSVGEECMATPALSAGSIIFRTKGHLLAIGFPDGK